MPPATSGEEGPTSLLDSQLTAGDLEVLGVRFEIAGVASQCKQISKGEY